MLTFTSLTKRSILKNYNLGRKSIKTTHNEKIIIHEQENCCRCDAPIEAWQGKGLIDGEPAHAQCALDEMDETGMDDFYGGNG